MDVKKEREAFETWLFSTEKFKLRNKNFLFMLDGYGSYEDKPVLEHWETWQAAKSQAVQENNQFNLDEFLTMEEKLKHKGGVITADLDRFIAYAEMVLEKTKTQAAPDTYTPIVLALEDVQSKIEKASFLTMDAENESEVYAVDANEISAYIDGLIEAQEPK